MLKLNSDISSQSLRVRRYLSTLINLWVAPIRLRPISELVIIVGGLISKLAPLAAFILTVQFAVWLISPDRAPQRLHSLLGYDSNPLWFHAAIITVPVLVFMLGSGAQKLSDHLSIQVRRRTAYALVEATLSARLTKMENTRSGISEFFKEIRADYQTVHRSVNSANNILNSVTTVLIAAFIGFLIAPFFVAILLTALSVLGVVFVAWRHGETNRLLERKQEMLNEEVALQKATQERLQQEAGQLDAGQKHALMSTFLSKAIGNPNELDDRFRSNTNFVSTFAPLIGVTALLAFLSGESEVTEERAAQLVMLVLVLRFCIGNIQSVIAAMIGLTRDYGRLAQIFHGSTVSGLGPVAPDERDKP